MRERLLGSRNALVLRNAPATEREFNVLRTAPDLMVALRVALPAESTSVLWPTELAEGVWAATERVTRELGRATEREIAGLALM
jgi:hypothetical protein